MKKKIMSLVMLNLMIVPFCLAREPQPAVIVKNAWVRPFPPSQKITAAFMEIKNPTKKNLELVSISTACAQTVEMHKMTHEDGMMKMEKIESIKIPAKREVKLEPGGMHLMLINLNEALELNSTVDLLLNFNDGTQSTVNAVIGDQTSSASTNEKPCCLHKH